MDCLLAFFDYSSKRTIRMPEGLFYPLTLRAFIFSAIVELESTGWSNPRHFVEWAGR